MSEPLATTQVIEWATSNAGWIIGLAALFLARQKDQKSIEVILAERGQQLLTLSRGQESLAAALRELHDGMQDNARNVQDMDHRFWSEKWPKVERALAHIEALDARVESIEAWRVAIEEWRQSSPR